MTIGENIKKYRKIKGFTQKKLGQLIGASDVMIRHYELGIRTPKKEKLLALSKALCIDTFTLIAPPIDSVTGVVNALFNLEVNYDLILEKNSNKISILLQNPELQTILTDWCEQQLLYKQGKISEIEYLDWKQHIYSISKFVDLFGYNTEMEVFEFDSENLEDE